MSFTPEMSLTTTKEQCLLRKQNKQRFVNMLGVELKRYNCQVYHEKADADYSIAQKTIDFAEHIDIVLVGDDIDLLILLLHHAATDKHNIFFAPEPKRTKKNMEYQGSKGKAWIICLQAYSVS